MKGELTNNPVLFLDDWPQTPKESTEEDSYEPPGFTNIKKWRIQTLLAVNPFGVPSLGFAAAYEKMFGKELDIQDMGFEHLWDMVSQMNDVFAVQEPDDLTAVLFPDYPSDKILHDARLGHDFESMQTGQALNREDPEILNSYAWFNRDDDFPTDVVLAGEKYQDFILPLTEASVPGTRGVYKAMMVSAAHPNQFCVNIKGAYIELITNLSNEVRQFFAACKDPIECYRVPDEFIHSGFACLVYIRGSKCWERCSIIGRCRDKVLVETVDFGGTHLVDQMYLHLMPRRFLSIPKQGLVLSLPGLKPLAGQKKFPSRAGCRMRCFSNLNYYLDVLLLEPKKKVMETLAIESRDTNNSFEAKEKTKSRAKDKFWRTKVHFEALVCDRNDEDLDIFLDEILIMENSVGFDDNRFKDEIEPIRRAYKKVLKDVPRPVNPM